MTNQSHDNGTVTIGDFTLDVDIDNGSVAIMSSNGQKVVFPMTQFEIIVEKLFAANSDQILGLQPRVGPK